MEINRNKKSAKSREERRPAKAIPNPGYDYEKIKEWKLQDADSGRDLAMEVRSYFIPDFSNWKGHDAFEKAFERLLYDLRASENKKM